MLGASLLEAGRRPARGRDVGSAIVATLTAGATIGLGVAAGTARMNPSLRDPLDATWFLAFGIAVYVFLLLPFGAFGLVVTRWITRAARPPTHGGPATALEETRVMEPAVVEEEPEELGPPPRSLLFARHLLIVLAGFAGYVLAQLLGATLFGWDETQRLALVLGVLAAFIGSALTGLVVTRAAFDRLLHSRGWFLPVLLGVANGFFLLLGLGGSESVTGASPSSDDGHSEVHAGDSLVNEVHATFNEPAPAASPEPEGPDAAAPRVVLLAIDGADWRRIDPLLESGRMPSLKHMLDRGVRTQLEGERPSWPAVSWNTLATGRPPREHGVCDSHEVRLPLLRRGVQRLYAKLGEPPLLPAGLGVRLLFDACLDARIFEERPVSSVQRGAKAVWNVLSEEGYDVAVVRWPASHPAEALNGWVVSNDDPWTGDFVIQEAWDPAGPDEDMVWPPELLDELGELVERSRNGRDFDLQGRDEDVEDEGREEATALSPLPIDDSLSGRERVNLEREPRLREEARLILSADLFSAESSLKLWREKQPDFLAVYLRSVYALGKRLDRYPGAVDGAYVWMDQVLGAWIAVAPEDTVFVIVSAYGLAQAGDGEGEVPPGILVLSGPGVRRNVDFERASIYEVAPTLLALYGEPASAELSGRPLLEAFSLDARRSIPERPRSFGPYVLRRTLAPRAAPEVDEIGDEPDSGESERSEGAPAPAGSNGS